MPNAPIKVTWHRQEDGVWKGVGVYRNYYAKQTKHSEWELASISPYGELVETWKGTTLAQCKRKAFNTEQQLKAVRMGIVANIIRSVWLDEEDEE